MTALRSQELTECGPWSQRMSLYVVVVLYNRSIEESPTCKDLMNQDCRSDQNVFLVYDNSERSTTTSIPEGWNLHLDPSNGGLSKAYNYALMEAKALNCGWLLLLDQDTNLPRDFLSRIHDILVGVETSPTIVAITPIVMTGERQASPMYPRLGREVLFRRRNVVVSEWLTAINSGTCVRIDFISEIGGFSEDFPLDYLDHWLFKMISNQGKGIYVSDLVLKHDLSVANMNEVSITRYRGVLAAELQFTNRYLPFFWRMVVVPRLIARAMKHLALTRDKRIAASMVLAATVQIGYLCWPHRTCDRKHVNS